MQNNGMQQIFGHKNKNANFSLAEAREYSDLYQRAKVQMVRKAQRTESPLDRLFAQKKSIKAKIAVLCEKRDCEGISDEEQKTLNGLFAELRKINSHPLMVEKHKASEFRNASLKFKEELWELYLRDTKFLPKERDAFVAAHKDLIKNMRFVDGVDVFVFEKDTESIQYHWVKQ